MSARSAVLLALLVAPLVASCRERAAPGADSAGASTAGGTTRAVLDSAPVTVPSRGAWQLTPTGGNGLVIGMTLADVGRVLGVTLTKNLYDEESTCSYAAGALPEGLGLMLEADTLVRIDVRDTTIATREGARVGDTEARVKSLYPGIVTQPHKYTGPEGHYLVFTPRGDARHRLVFETDGTRVTEWRVGRVPEVEYVEGCS
jgi:hypothetical protein